MALRLKESDGRTAVLISKGVHPDWRGTLATYMKCLGLQLVEVELNEGATDQASFAAALAARKVDPSRLAAIAIQTPNFFGTIENVKAVADAAHALGALCVVGANPIALSLVEAPGKQGADMVCGEATSMGNKAWFGGPGAGYLCSRMEFVRQMPARIAGETRDGSGRRAFVLTFATREQHIRRAKATSNICTNVALFALMATIYLATLGKQGLQRVGELSTAKAHYAADQLTRIPGVSLRFAQPFFKEFTLRLPKSPTSVVARLAKRRILPGVPLKTYDKTLADSLLVAVTEQRTKDEIDAFAGALAEVLK